MKPGKARAGRIAVVMDGTRGIGLAVARALAEDSASVVVSGRDAARPESAVTELERLGASAVGVAADQSLAGVAHGPRRGGDVDDAPALLLHYRLGRCARHQEHAPGQTIHVDGGLYM